MPILISFRKGRGKPDTLSVQRSDGSVTWSQGQAGPAYHDLAHYVVETTLGCERAFFGIINQGFAIDDFVLPRHLRPDALRITNLPDEAMQVEYIVNSIQQEYFNQVEDADLLASLQAMLADKGIPFPKQLTEVALQQIRGQYRALIAGWNALPPGETLTVAY